MTTRFEFINDLPLIGSHVSKDASITTTIKKILVYPINSAQLYISSSRSYSCSLPNLHDMEEAKRLIALYKLRMFIHASLMYNLHGCTNLDDPNYDRNLKLTIANLTTELDIAACMGFVGVVVHIGSAACGVEGLPRISKTVTECLKRTGVYTEAVAKHFNISTQELIDKRVIILENAAGEGNKRGSTIAEIRDIINGVDEEVRNRVRVCIDTAHLFGAGEFDISKPEEMLRMLSTLDRELGETRVALFHLNDSDLKFGSHRDSHMNLFRGRIFAEELVEDFKEKRRTYFKMSIGSRGMETLSYLISYSCTHDAPLIIESPSSSFPDVTIVRTIYESVVGREHESDIGDFIDLVESVFGV